jgi:hypothetical protein
MGVLPQALKIIFQVQRKKSNTKRNKPTLALPLHRPVIQGMPVADHIALYLGQIQHLQTNEQIIFTNLKPSKPNKYLNDY